MTLSAAGLRYAYSQAFETYLTSRSEEALHAAYELGRTAVSNEVNLMDLSSTHHDALVSALRKRSPHEIERVTDAAAGFFLETLSAFEIVQRGFQEATSIAVEKQRLYERERRIAETLQRRLLPQRLPAIPNVSMAVRYLPGAAGVNVGGDWFDAVKLPDGKVGIAVGDVMGRGVRAASVMGQVRTAFRAYALRGATPKSVIERLNRLIPTLDTNHFSTMIYLHWEPRERLARLVRAGHPPPLIASQARPPAFLESEVAIPLGVLPEAGYRNVRIHLEPGTMLVFYTDGLIEQEDDPRRGLERLRRSVRWSANDLELVCDRVLEEMPLVNPPDDVALFVVRFD
jgi:serine phosphatase RsbU (regulator of sigma subunit)